MLVFFGLAVCYPLPDRQQRNQELESLTVELATVVFKNAEPITFVIASSSVPIPVVEMAFRIGMILLVSQSPFELDADDVSLLKLIPAVTVPLLVLVCPSQIPRKRFPLPIVLSLRSSQLTNLCGLTISRTCRQVVIARFPSVVLLEYSIVVLEEHSYVVPKSRRELRTRICDRRI